MKGSIGRVVEWALRRDALPRHELESQLALTRRELETANEAAERARGEAARLQAESSATAAAARDLELRASVLLRDLAIHSELIEALRGILGISEVAPRAALLARKAASLTGASASWIVSSDDSSQVRVSAGLEPGSEEAPEAVRALATWWFRSQAGHSLRLAPGHMPSSPDDPESAGGAGIDHAVLAVRVAVAPVLGVLLLRDDGFSGRDEVAVRDLAELVETACRACCEHDRATRKALVSELELARLEVDRRDRSLHEARGELVARERKSMLGEVTATVSHELRNPLGVIRSSVFYLQRRIGRDDEKVVKHLERIEQQVGVCNGVIDDLLEFTRGRQAYLVPGDVNAWLSSVVESRASSDPSICFLTELAPDLPPVAFDADKMRRALANVLENAVLAVRAHAEQPPSMDWKGRIVVRSVRRDSGSAIEVADNGIGMDEATRARAFDPLFTTRARGTGLGLAIVRKIIEDHGGRIGIESSPGLGTTVTVELPEHAPQPVLTSEASP